MDYLSHIRRESEQFLTTALAGSMDVAVPSCPGWDMTGLVGHLGVVQHYHGANLLRGVTDRPQHPRPTPPTTGLVEWFEGGYQQLLANLESVGTDSPAWTFQPGNLTTAFWHRRMAHEALVHRWDAQFARGQATALDPELAVDGISEYVDVFLARRRRGEEAPPGTVVLAPIEGIPVEVTSGEADRSRVRISGPAEQLLLAVWGRVPLTDLEVEGDLELAQSVVNR